MDVCTVRSHISKLAKDFDLKYDPAMFKHMWISARHNTLMEYLGVDCPDPIYKKYGSTNLQRINNIGRFLASSDFQECLGRYGGQVAGQKDIPRERKLIRKIRDARLRKELIRFEEKLSIAMGEAKSIAVLTRPKNEKQKRWMMDHCLRHEWIHILLDMNGIRFQKTNRKHWPYDEGLDEYMGCYLDGTLEKLEHFRDAESYPTEKRNWIYAIRFRKLLDRKRTPEERKKAILDLIAKLKP